MATDRETSAAPGTSLTPLGLGQPNKQRKSEGPLTVCIFLHQLTGIGWVRRDRTTYVHLEHVGGPAGYTSWPLSTSTETCPKTTAPMTSGASSGNLKITTSSEKPC